MGGKAEYRPQHRLWRAVAAHAFPRTRELRWWNSGVEAWEVWQGGGCVSLCRLLGGAGFLPWLVAAQGWVALKLLLFGSL
jgi:hypothetical protein